MSSPRSDEEAGTRLPASPRPGRPIADATPSHLWVRLPAPRTYRPWCGGHTP